MLIEHTLNEIQFPVFGNLFFAHLTCRHWFIFVSFLFRCSIVIFLGSFFDIHQTVLLLPLVDNCLIVVGTAAIALHILLTWALFGLICISSGARSCCLTLLDRLSVSLDFLLFLWLLRLTFSCSKDHLISFSLISVSYFCAHFLCQEVVGEAKWFILLAEACFDEPIEALITFSIFLRSELVCSSPDSRPLDTLPSKLIAMNSLVLVDLVLLIWNTVKYESEFLRANFNSIYITS